MPSGSPRPAPTSTPTTTIKLNNRDVLFSQILKNKIMFILLFICGRVSIAQSVRVSVAHYARVRVPPMLEKVSK